MTTAAQGRVTATRRNLRSGAAGHTLEAELSQALRLVKTARDRKLVARHLGWDGRPPCSLNGAGAKFSVTRERARQVYAKALPLLQQYGAVPVLDAVLAFIRKHPNKLASEVERELQRSGYTKGTVSLPAVLRAAEVFGRPPGFQLHRVGGQLFAGAVSEFARSVLRAAMRAVARHGAASVSSIRRELTQSRSRPADEPLVRRILQTRADIHWLDEDGEWFWLDSVPRNRLLARVQKVMAVHRRIRISTLHEAISRDYRAPKIPAFVLGAICDGLSWCQADAQHIEAIDPPKVEMVLSDDEAVVCKVLREHGGVLPLPKLQKLCFTRGVRKPSLWRILTFSPLLRRFDKAVYGLTGVEADSNR